jgi:hypothetical protein
VQAVYGVCILLSTILLGMSYMPGRLHLVKFPFLILMFRNSLRLYNFEGIETGCGLESAQLILYIIVISMYETSFEVSTENYVLASLSALWTAVGGGLVFNKHKTASIRDKIILVAVSGLCFLILKAFISGTSSVI